AKAPTRRAADPVQEEGGSDLAPEILANSGGDIVSYYEGLQNNRSECWELEEVETRLEHRMKSTYGQARHYAKERNIDLRSACYGIGLERIQRVYRERGIFP